VNNKRYAMYVETSEDTYEEYTTSNMFPEGYKLNKDKSVCLDNKGKKVDNILSGKYNRLTVTSSKTTYCYIYFDKHYTLSELCSSGDNLGSCLTTNNEEIDSLNDNIEGGLYRYQGTQELVDDNYICFGTTSKEECTSNTDAYMYRIIGIDENNQLKLIKKEALNEKLQWNSSNGVIWPNSTIYANINGSSYLTNSTYMPTGWNNKIVDYNWKYGTIDNSTEAGIGDEQTGFKIYEIENSWENMITAKIGLMYLHDYIMGYTGNSICGGTTGDKVLCKSAWIHMSHNDIEALSDINWFMTSTTNGGAWNVRDEGHIYYTSNLTDWRIARPVFYLNSDEQYISGDGTLDDPIIIGEPEPNAGETLLSNSTTGLDTTTSYSGMYRYIGTEANNYVQLSDGTNEVLYRIIGIVSEDNDTLGLEANQVKVIKAASIGTYDWHTSFSENATWNTGGTDAEIYTYLQGGSVLGSTSVIPSGWSSKISSVKWNIGDVQTYTNGDTVYGLEDDSQTTNASKIGLMYMSDYYYAYNAGGTGFCVSIACTNWLTDTSNNTWTMTRYGYDEGGDSYLAGVVRTNGYVGYATLDYANAVRPVFYLTNDVYITNPTATGTSIDPFILSY